MLSLRNTSALLCALKAKLTFMVALVEIVKSGYNEGACERLPHTIMWRNLRTVCRDGEHRIGAQGRGDFFCLHLGYVVGICLQCGIRSFKAGLHLIPGQALLRGNGDGRKRKQHRHRGWRQVRKDSVHTYALRRGLHGELRKKES